MKSVADSLAGRVGLLELETLSAAELGPSLTQYIAQHGPARALAGVGFSEL